MAVVVDSTRGGSVRIEIRGRNVEVTDDLRRAVEKRFERLGRQVRRRDARGRAARGAQPGDRRPGGRRGHPASQGVTLHASESSPDMLHSIKALAEDMRRQVKRHRDKRRKRARPGGSSGAFAAAPHKSRHVRRVTSAVPSGAAGGPVATLTLDGQGPDRPRPADGRGAPVQGVREARRVDQPRRARDGAARRRRAARGGRQAPRAGPQRRVARRPAPEAFALAARRRGARSASATSTSS